MRLFVATLIALATTFASAGVARGADGHALLQRGIQQHREASYAASVATLEQARATRSLQSAELVECAFYLGANYVAINSPSAARRELRAVLEAQPSYELPQYTSPKVVALFREVREELEHAPRLKALPPRHPESNRIEVVFEASRGGAGAVYGAAYWRWRGEHDFREAPLAHQGDVLIAPVTLDRNGSLEYYAEARAPGGLALAGSPARPLELPIAGVPIPPPVDKRPRRNWAKAWWLWTAVGAVAAAGLGVGLYFALRPNPPSTADAVLSFGVH